jgi:GNAT superfamily N-acetyltransferase
VDPGYRRKGVGRSLVKYIERKARAQGAVRLTLMTAWQNTGAHGFYQALGYSLYTISMQRSLLDIEQSQT